MGTSYGIFPHLGVYNDCRNDLICEHQCYQEHCYLPIVVLITTCSVYNFATSRIKENGIYIRDLKIILSNIMCFCISCSTGDV
jgi:hypothetical protein